MKRTRLLGVGVLILAMAAAFAACGDDDDDDDDDGGGPDGGTVVNVTLQEFAIIPDVQSVPAGSVTFEATNEGPEDEHELVVLRTDLAPDALPTREDGSADEEAEGIEEIGEIEEFPVGESETATFDLEAGNYVLICNIVEVEEAEGETEAHYALGMRVAFTVE